ncbi:MAG: toll/interleukin-1 receptor domain-containing protein [Pseudomonadota bacterium]
MRRDTIFISKATPGDDAFVLWLAPRLEAAGYRVFADVLGRAGGNGLKPGDAWRLKLTDTLQENSVKMLLCCTTETLRRRGVQEEYGIAEDLARELEDANFIIPLRLAPFKKMFGMGELQYLDFHKRWAAGLKDLLDRLEEFNVPKAHRLEPSDEWQTARAHFGVGLREEPEVLTSNWLRIESLPDEVHFLESKGLRTDSQLRVIGNEASLPAIPHGSGLISFASGIDFAERCSGKIPFEIADSIDVEEFIEDGWESLGIEQREARRQMVNLLRQAWEYHCTARGFAPYQFSKGLAFHASESLVASGKRVPWGRQGQRRSSMLRNESRGKLWEFGVEAIPSLYPFPHFKLRSRVRFSDLEEGKNPSLIEDKRAQFRLRRSVCSVWRNKAWHGRIMAFLELLAGESPLIALQAGSGEFVELDGMPLQTTVPFTARQTDRQDEDAEEEDKTTLQGFIEEEGDLASNDGEVA